MCIILIPSLTVSECPPPRKKTSKFNIAYNAHALVLKLKLTLTLKYKTQTYPEITV